MVLLLYILSTALHFSRELSFPEFWKTANARISEYSYEEYADGLYRVEIERELRTALALSQPMASLRLTEEAVCLVKGVSLTEAEQLLRAAGWQGEIREELP